MRYGRGSYNARALAHRVAHPRDRAARHRPHSAVARGHRSAGRNNIVFCLPALDRLLGERTKVTGCGALGIDG